MFEKLTEIICEYVEVEQEKYTSGLPFYRRSWNSRLLIL